MRSRPVAVPAAIALTAFVAHWLEGRGIVTVWKLPDELNAAQAGRAVAGRAAGSGWSLYSLVTAPLWLLGPGAGYAAVKVLGAACVSATAVAAHALAQRLAPGWPAAAAALAAALLPATVFGSAVDPSALAYPLCAAGALAAVAVAEAPSRRLLAVAAVALSAAVWAWPPAGFVAAGIALGAVIVAAPRALLGWPLSGGTILLAGALYAGYYGLRPHSQALSAAATAGVGRVVASGLASWGALAIGTAVIPFAAALACGLALVRVRRAEGVIALVTIPLAALGAGVLAQAQGTDGRPAAEAAVMLAAPLVLALAAGAIVTAVRLLPALAGLALAGVCVAFADGLAWRHLPVHAPGLALGGPTGLTPWELGVFLAGAAAITAATASLLVGRRFARPAIVAVAVAALIATEVGASARAASRADRLARTLPTPRELPGGRGLALLVSNGVTAAELLFWNPSSTLVEPPLERRSLDPATGFYSPPLSPAALYLDPSGRLAGTVVRRTKAGRVLKPTDPVRADETVEGLYVDGWSGAKAVYRRFDVSGPGVLRLRLSRAGWGGPDVANGVTVRLGPVDGNLRDVRRVAVHAKHKIELALQTPSTPFAVEIDSQTFSPSSFGQPDRRQLGVQLGFDYESAR